MPSIKIRVKIPAINAVAGYLAAKRRISRCGTRGASERSLKIIETLSMGDKRSISMIEMGNRRFLVGNTARRISLLMELPEPASAISEHETLQKPSNSASEKNFPIPYKNLFEAEKIRPVQRAVQLLPDGVYLNMRQLP